MPRPVLPRFAVAALAVGLGLGAVACDTDDGRTMDDPTDEQRAAQPTTTSSTSTTLVPGLGADSVNVGVPTTTAFVEPFAILAPWQDGGEIDARFTCDGANRSPTLRWTAPPDGTVELALAVTDDDAPTFVHWAVGRIPPLAGEVGEGLKVLDAIEGRNGAGTVGYTGPCPPGAGTTHTYRFTVYALAEPLTLAADVTGTELLEAARAVTIASAEISATYTRAG